MLRLRRDVFSQNSWWLILKWIVQGRCEVLSMIGSCDSNGEKSRNLGDLAITISSSSIFDQLIASPALA